jgi:hypothetical protein
LLWRAAAEAFNPNHFQVHRVLHFAKPAADHTSRFDHRMNIFQMHAAEIATRAALVSQRELQREPPYDRICAESQMLFDVPQDGRRPHNSGGGGGKKHEGARQSRGACPLLSMRAMEAALSSVQSAPAILRR